ncbi:MAG: NAD-dependent epimerase/dehydratase family protein, partial [Anaerolineales bacterium]
MKVLIAGGTGLVGRALSADLVKHGHEVFILSRSPESPVNSQAGVKMLTWDGKTTSGWSDILNEIDVVVNLAGAPLDGKNVFDIWLTEKRKKLVVSSRLDTTNALIEGIKQVKNKPKVYVQGSAVGYYGFSG